MTDEQIRGLAKGSAFVRSFDGLKQWKEIVDYGIDMFKEGESAAHKELSNGGWIHRFNSEEEFLEYLKMKNRIAIHTEREIPENTKLWDVLVGVRDFKYFIQDAVNYININRQSILAEDFIEYCYDFAWQYGRLFHVGDAEKIKAAISEKFQLPEEFLQGKKIPLENKSSKQQEAFYCTMCEDAGYCASNRICLKAQQPWPTEGGNQ